MVKLEAASSEVSLFYSSSTLLFMFILYIAAQYKYKYAELRSRKVLFIIYCVLILGRDAHLRRADVDTIHMYSA